MAKKSEVIVSKSVQRAELAADVAAFLAAGGQIEVVEPKKRKVKHVHHGKTTKSRRGSGSLGYSSVRMGV